MKVLIIAEDPTLDQYILKPIVERILLAGAAACLSRNRRVEAGRVDLD